VIYTSAIAEGAAELAKCVARMLRGVEAEAIKSVRELTALLALPSERGRIPR
jgi:hypothetical protein